MKNMELSIIIPVYNAENYIDQCLSSIIKQNIPIIDYEILIIDDGSTDHSMVIAKNYSYIHKNIQLYFQKNQGVSIARNNGIKYAKGKYIYFVDADDYIALNTLNKLIQIANENNLDILEFSSIRTKFRNFVNSNTNNILTKDLEIIEGYKYISSKFHDALWVYFFNREFLINSKLKFYEGRTKQDMIFNAELIPKAKRVAYYPLDVYRYVITPNSITTRTDSIGLRRSIEDFVFITIKYNELILKLENQKIDISILKSKQQIQLFNIFKGILMSNFKLNEISEIIEKLTNKKLYPLHNYRGNNVYKKYLVLCFNNKFIFLLALWFYRIFSVTENNSLIKNYRNKKERRVKISFK